MKILHTSDWHLGRPDSTGKTAEDQKFIFDRIFDLIRERNADVLVCAGDVYDSSVVAADAIRLYNEIMTDLCLNMRVPCVIIAGNHDSGHRLASCNKLLDEAGLHIRGRIAEGIEKVSIGDTDFWPVPYFARDEVYSLFPHLEENSVRSAEEAMQLICDDIRSRMDPARKNVLLSHSFVGGAVLAESDRSARLGNAQAVSSEAMKGFDYVALGHIHHPQPLNEGGTIWYSGSPLAYDFGRDSEHDKGVVLFDTETGAAEFIPLTPLRRRVTLECTKEELFAAIEGMSEKERGDYYRVKVTDEPMTGELRSRILDRLPNARETLGVVQSGGDAADARAEETRLDDGEILERFLKEYYAGREAQNWELQLFAEMMNSAEQEDRT